MAAAKRSDERIGRAEALTREDRTAEAARRDCQWRRASAAVVAVALLRSGCAPTVKYCRAERRCRAGVPRKRGLEDRRSRPTRWRAAPGGSCSAIRPQRARTADRRVQPDAEGRRCAVRAGARAGARHARRPLPAGRHRAHRRRAAQPSGNRPASTLHQRRQRFRRCRSMSSYEADVWGRIHSAVSASRARRRRPAPADLETRAPEPARRARARLLHAARRRSRSAAAGCGGGVVREGARADAEPLPRRHRVAGRRRAGRDRSSKRRGRRRSMSASRARRSSTRLPCWSGTPASTFSVARRRRSPTRRRRCRPACPSELLERRPDIAAAERRVAAANAQLGVATAAFYPRLIALRHRRLRKQPARRAC